MQVLFPFFALWPVELGGRPATHLLYPPVLEMSCFLDLFDCLVQELCFVSGEGGLWVTGPSLKYLGATWRGIDPRKGGGPEFDQIAQAP